MKHRLTTTIEAVALVGCGESQSKKSESCYCLTREQEIYWR